MRDFFVVLLFLSLFFLVGCALLQSESGTVKLLVGKEPAVVNVEFARTSEEFERGLMFREKLDVNSGMLFVFGDELPRGFWMKNTMIPLDLIFISAEKIVVDVKENFMPCSGDVCEVYTSLPAMFVLEVNSGFVRQNNVFVGTRVII